MSCLLRRLSFAYPRRTNAAPGKPLFAGQNRGRDRSTLLSYNASVIDAATDALRRNSPAVLRAGLLRLLDEGELQWLQDRRDLLVAMAPYYDCARRLELDPAAFFAAVAENGPIALADIVRSFGEHADVTPAAFGFRLVMSPDGATYEWAQ
jgi:hypothetical protein